MHKCTFYLIAEEKPLQRCTVQIIHVKKFDQTHARSLGNFSLSADEE